MLSRDRFVADTTRSLYIYSSLFLCYNSIYCFVLSYLLFVFIYYSISRDDCKARNVDSYLHLYLYLFFLFYLCLLRGFFLSSVLSLTNS